MKNNLKKKVMLAVLAGGMLCANGAMARTLMYNHWYGSGTPISWKGVIDDPRTFNPGDACKTGANLEVTDGLSVSGIALADVDYIYGGYTRDDEAVTGNFITFNTTDTTKVKATIHGARNDSDNGDIAKGNSVIINGGTFSGEISGAFSSGGDVEGNSVSITDGIISGNVTGGLNVSDDNDNITKNTLTISGGKFEGGNRRYCAGGSSSWNGDVTDNTMTIEGGTFSGNYSLYGGRTIYGKSSNNTVTIEGGTFSDGYSLYGGYTEDGTSSNNTLNLKTRIDGKATEVGYFQIMNFTLPADIKNDDTMLKTEKVTFDNTKISVDASLATLNKGDIITLIASDNVPTGVWETGTVTGPDGTITLEGNNLIFTVTGASGDDTAVIKAVAEGIAASLAFVNQGADIVAGSGIDGLSVADSENPTIAAFSGNKTRYNTGSHVDIHGWNALVGVALNNKKSFSHGVFVELGNGDIDTYAALDGSGSSDYKGGGYMLRKDLGKGWGIDGAVRAGRVETSWGNNDKGSYEAKQSYYGAHVTFNKMLKEYNEQKLNGYLRYSFTHLGSDSVKMDDVNYGFDSVNSHRTRLGARMVDEGQNGFELYYGAAWEYGFGGDCDATVNGVTTSGPAVDGSSAVFEVGGTWSNAKWEINAGLEGYLGAKRGAAGGMNFIYKF